MNENETVQSGWRIRASRQLVRFGLSAVVLLAVAFSHSSTLAQSLDDQLFEDLQEPDAIGQSKPNSANPKSANPKSVRPKSADSKSVDRKQFEDALHKELGGDQPAGEDLGRKPEGPLAQTAELMRDVRDRLAAKDTAAQTRLMQNEIVSQLDKLIDKLKQQKNKSGGGGSSGGQPKPKPKPKSNPQPSQGGAKQAPKQRAAGMGNAESAAGGASQDQLMQKSWGKLPANVRQQMQSARPEKLLPKYAKQIEDYFRRLAEEEQ